MSMDVFNLTICMMNHFRLRGYLFCMLLQLQYYFSRIVHPCHTVPISPLLHCPPLPHRADMSTPAFSTPPFLTVPFCPLPQIPSILSSIDSHKHLRSANRGQLQVLRISMSTYGSRAFGHADPSTSNVLPNIPKCSTHSLPVFRSHLKHFYFSYYQHTERV